MKINLIPYQSVGPYEFGASEAATKSILDETFSQRVNFKGEKTIYFKNLNFVFSTTNQLVEITIFPEAKLLVAGANIFQEGDVHGYLKQIDEFPLEYVGLIFYQKLGLSIGGTEIGADFAVTAISKGRFDLLLPKFKLAQFK